MWDYINLGKEFVIEVVCVEMFFFVLFFCVIVLGFLNFCVNFVGNYGLMIFLIGFIVLAGVYFFVFVIFFGVFGFLFSYFKGGFKLVNFIFEGMVGGLLIFFGFIGMMS